ncbi:SecDF P1 head subdomain-containing protein [Spirillospora sp. CA-142024]|uniref:SecDF P1 head subdomain-containing protein n=1 Tax=Spirillospora sp. CA-142024 TaxID=3240036 RepID=UPI003D8CBFBD
MAMPSGSAIPSGDGVRAEQVVEAAQPFYPAGGSTRPMEVGKERAGDPAESLESPRERGPATAVLPAAKTQPLDTEAARRRARAAQRRREAAEAKRSRAARRQGRPYREPVAPAKAADQHRSALLVMVLTLGVLIAAVAVTGAMIASSMQARPVTLAAPLHIYPVAQAAPGQCPAGTQGITGQSATGVTCYRLTQGIAIHKVADLRVQKSRVKPGGYDVAVTLRPVDRRAFAGLTRATVGRDLAFVVRDRLITLPRVDMAITDGKVVVTGSPDRASANTLVRELKGR